MKTDVKAYDLLRDSEARNKELEWLSNIESMAWIKLEDGRSLSPGVSVIIPAYKSKATLGATLTSLANQTLERRKYELIVVLNGDDDGTMSLVEEFSKDKSDINLRFVHSGASSAGRARNVGINLARREFITFVDADDEVLPRFLETMLDYAASSRVVVTPIVNRHPDGSLDTENALNKRILGLAGEIVSLASVPWLLGFNACKLLPTKVISKYRYSENLRSGEDLVFFAHLLCETDLIAVFPSFIDDSAYVRNLRDDSVSRQPASYSFNVEQRVACVQALMDIEVPAENLNARQSLESAQLNFVRNYLESHPESVDKLDEHLGSIGFISFPWFRINKGKARDLVLLYCAAPFADTSAVVAEKVISEGQKIVDVIAADLTGVRNVDASTLYLSSRWVDERVTVQAPASFAGWGPISDFARSALETAESMAERKGGYKSLYSRALWIGSHVAAALFKNRHPSIYWSAEFSDPLRFGVDGSPRPGAYEQNDVSELLTRVVNLRGYSHLELGTLFDLVELVTFLLADELIFTNANQLEYMLSFYPAELQHEARAKSVVRPHPSPNNSAYTVVSSSFIPDRRKINIGYFGSFYKNRGLGDVFTAFINLSQLRRHQFQMSIFVNSVDDARTEVTRWGLDDVVKVFPYLPYMEFLNATTKFDVLLVNDVVRSDGLEINPFLPSKLSDYKSSGAKVWGLVDNGSPLSEQRLDYVSEVGNSVDIINTLGIIAEDFRG